MVKSGGRLKKYRTEFSGAWTQADEGSPKKSILISGTARGGTSFAASVFKNLGVGMSLGDAKEELGSTTHENRELREAFAERDEERLRKMTRKFSRTFDVWAWKLPALNHDLEFVMNCVENPHFVFIFKEPVSIAFRRNDIKAVDFLAAMHKSLKEYQTMVSFTEKTGAPTMFIGYDSAVTNMEAFVEDAAAFAGVEDYDLDAVVAAIRQDGERYYPEKPPAEAAATA